MDDEFNEKFTQYKRMNATWKANKLKAQAETLGVPFEFVSDCCDAPVDTSDNDHIWCTSCNKECMKQIID